MNRSIGFIGCGNMAQAMISGIIKAHKTAPDMVIASNPSCGKLDKVRESYNIKVTSDNKEAASFSDILILAIKPNKHKDVINEIKDSIKPGAIIVTIAAGISMSYAEELFGKEIKLVRAMPNTPALVGEGMSALCRNRYVSDEELSLIKAIFESFGDADIIDESLMDMIPSVSGSSPAYVYMFIEALADGAVLRGMPRKQAYRFAAKAVAGAARMVLETGLHPGELKDNVCSPGGTTIEAVYSLEKNNFRGSIIEAMEKCTEKAIQMSHKS